MKYVIPPILAFFVGLGLWQIQRDRLAMDYELIESEPFPQDTGSGRYFILRLRNTGNRPITDISLEVRLAKSEFTHFLIAEPSLAKDIKNRLGVVTGTIPLLNPDERFAVTLTASGETVTSPSVSARAHGVTALPRRDSTSVQYLNLLVVVGSLGFTIFVLWNVLGPTRMNQERRMLKERSEKATQELDRSIAELRELQEELKSGEPASEQQIFSVLNQTGVGHVFI